MSSVFDIEIKEDSGNIIYTVYDKAVLKNPKNAKKRVCDLPSDQYLAMVKINKTTGKLVFGKMGTKPKTTQIYQPQEVAKIINASSLIANGNSLGREDPVIYLSTILNSWNCIFGNGERPLGQVTTRGAGATVGKQNQQIEVRFPYYTNAVGAKEPSDAAKNAIEKFYTEEKNYGKTLIIPYGINRDSKNGHIGLLIIERNKENEKPSIRYFDSSCEFKYDKDNNDFGCLRDYANKIESIIHNKIQDEINSCSYYVEAFLKLLYEKGSIPEIGDNATIPTTVKGQATELILTAKSSIKELSEKISTKESDYKGTSYKSQTYGSGGKLTLDETEKSSELSNIIQDSPLTSLQQCGDPSKATRPDRISGNLDISKEKLSETIK